MKKILFRIVILISLISLLVTPAYAYSQNDPYIIPLIAGQHENAGSIKVWDDGDYLYILYETNSPWCLTETHLAVASTLDGIPQKNGNPIPGQFPYKSSNNCDTSQFYKITLDQNACVLYIAAHAVVKRPGSTETAWGSGADFLGKNWATYFIYKTNACSATPTPTASETPTDTPTSTSTDTPTGPPPIATSTNTPTDTPTSTSTDTPTGTPPTATSTNTPTGTPSNCQPTVVTADFSKIAVGSSVEGMGVVAPNLNIDAKGTAIKILPAKTPYVYAATASGTRVYNGGISSSGGFSDQSTRLANQAHLYTFTFAPGTSASNFSLHMLDFGDLNPTLSTSHYTSMTAYDTNGVVISQQVLSYTTPPEIAPSSSDLYGDLRITGDADGAAPGQPGNWTWNVSGNGIVRVVLEFGVGFDPAIGFDTLSFTTTECPQACQPNAVTADFSKTAVGSSVEGMGVVAPNLNIDAKGTAIKILPAKTPYVYAATASGTRVYNGGISSSGGFSDQSTRLANQAHLYTFTFAPGTSASNFSLHMLDFGDLNPTLSTSHYTSMTAYDTNGVVISQQVLSYTTPPEIAPSSSDLYGDLRITGDADGAAPGQPGNWTWNVSGNGIVRVVLEFGVGFDPAIGFDTLSFTTECPPTSTPPTATSSPTGTATTTTLIQSATNQQWWLVTFLKWLLTHLWRG